jgi:hypothetical protein
MNWKTDPPRLRDLPDDMPDALTSALDELGGGAPTARELGALRTNVRLALGLPPGGGPQHPPTAPSTSGPLAAPAAKGALTASQWVSWIVAPLGAGAVAGAVLLGATRSREPQTTVPIAAPSIAVSAAPRQDSTAFPIAQPIVPEAPPRAAMPTSDRAPRAAAPRAPAAPIEEDVPRVEPSPAPGTEHDPVASAPIDRETEVSLLSRAQEALGRDPARALDLVHDHEQRFGTGLLVQEREVIAIEALVQLGRKQEAEARAAAFRARFPRSAHGRRLDVLLHGGSN